MKIALIGKICSGKSFISSYLEKNSKFKVYSFGCAVKQYAKEIFQLNSKNRKIIQDFAQKMKEIDENVWINYVIDKINKDNAKNIIVDDVRFPNEYEILKKMDFIFIKLNISEELQRIRIKNTYKEDYEIHLERINNISEKYINDLSSNYTLNITLMNENNILNNIDDIILENPYENIPSLIIPSLIKK